MSSSIGGAMGRRRRARTAAAVVCYLAALAVLVLIGGMQGDTSGAWLCLSGTVLASFALGLFVPRWVVLGVPVAIASGLLALAIAILESGTPSPDNDPTLALYILAVPIVAFVSMAVPMLVGILLARTSDRRRDMGSSP